MLLLRPTVGIHLPGNRVGHIHTHTRVGRLISVRRMPRMCFLKKICSFPLRPYDHPPVYSAAEVETSTKALCVCVYRLDASAKVRQSSGCVPYSWYQRICTIVPFGGHAFPDACIRKTVDAIPTYTHTDIRVCVANLLSSRCACI